MEPLETTDILENCLFQLYTKKLSLENEGRFYRVWQWYPNKIIKALKKQGLIRIFFSTIFLTKKGKRKAIEIQKKYLDINSFTI